MRATRDMNRKANSIKKEGDKIGMVWYTVYEYMYAWMNDDGSYNSLVTTHRVHDISPILPHVVADTTHITHLAIIRQTDLIFV